MTSLITKSICLNIDRCEEEKMSRLKLQQLVNRITSLGLVFILAVGMMTACGKKKEDNKADSMTQENASENNANEESENTNKDRTAELIGVWQLNADTPAGDPYIFELEFGKDDHVSYCGYSMTGNNWFQNFCYDGSVSHKSIIGQDEGPGYEYFIEYEDGSFDICIEASELDENGTETDRFSSEYNVKISDEKDSIELKHISGKYVGFDETEDVVTFVRVDKAVNPGDSVTADEYDWQNMYWSLLNEFQRKPFDYYHDYFDEMPDDILLLDILDGKSASSYYLYDMDNDTIPELIVVFETSDDDRFGLFCKAETNNMLSCHGGYPMEYTNLYSDPDNYGLIIQKVDMGTSEITRITLTEDVYETENISVEYYNGHGEPIYNHAPDVVEGAVLLNPNDIKDFETLRLATEGQGPNSEQIRLLEEAITIFPVSPWYSDEYKAKRDITNAGWEVLGNWRGFANNQKSYAGLDFISEKLTAPSEVFSAYGYFDSGDKVDCIRTDTAMLERALQDFFDTNKGISRDCYSYDCKVDDDYVTLWGEAFLESKQYGYMKWLAFKDHMEGDTLVIDAMFQDGNSLETNDYAMKFMFYQNPESFYGYTLINYETVKSENTLKYTLSQVKDAEKFIREFVNGNSEGKDLISLKAGTDGCPYARDLYYINRTPIFAYYHSATDGSLDNRYYFEAGRMIEWIEGNGNDDSSRERYYVSDYPLNARWKETEKQVLKDAEYYLLYVDK